jgi:type IV secretory pathway VirB2 component (pilin)
VNSDWASVFLGAIAVSTAVMAVVQLGVIVYAARLARRVDELSNQIQHEIVPVTAHLKVVGQNLERMSGLATVQVERIDRLVADLSQRIDDTLTLVQGAVVGPLREGMAVVGAVRGVLAAVRGFRAGSRPSVPRADDEDPLFIG